VGCGEKKPARGNTPVGFSVPKGAAGVLQGWELSVVARASKKLEEVAEEMDVGGVTGAARREREREASYSVEPQLGCV
jgi:hypothetical protein